MAKQRIALYPGTFDPFTLGHLDLILRKPGDRQSDPQNLRRAVRSRNSLNIIRRIAVRCGLRGLVERTLDAVKTEQKWRTQRRNANHDRSPFQALRRTGLPTNDPLGCRRNPPDPRLRRRTAEIWPLQRAVQALGERLRRANRFARRHAEAKT